VAFACSRKDDDNEDAEASGKNGKDGRTQEMNLSSKWLVLYLIIGGQLNRWAGLCTAH
jgi:hypothetical protein